VWHLVGWNQEQTIFSTTESVLCRKAGTSAFQLQEAVEKWENVVYICWANCVRLWTSLMTLVSTVVSSSFVFLRCWRDTYCIRNYSVVIKLLIIIQDALEHGADLCPLCTLVRWWNWHVYCYLTETPSVTWGEQRSLPTMVNTLELQVSSRPMTMPRHYWVWCANRSILKVCVFLYATAVGVETGVWWYVWLNGQLTSMPVLLTGHFNLRNSLFFPWQWL